MTCPVSFGMVFIVMNTKYTGKKWAKAEYNRLCKTWFMDWMFYEKNVERVQSEQIWNKNLTELSFVNSLLTEYSKNPVRLTKRFEKFLDLSTNNL